MPNSELPEEILMDIFSRLPVKSVGRCRCLAKPWSTLLSTPLFLKSHFTRKPHNENLILIARSYFIHSIATINSAAPRNLDLPSNNSEVAGSYDGLVLLLNEEHHKLLVNPITLEQVKIPDSPLALKKDESFSMYGFGCDRLSNDYKVVTLSYYDTDNEHEPDCEDTFVDVYSVKRGVWTRVDCSPYDHAVPEISAGAFVNGVIHWLACSRESGYRSVIAAFDLVDEVFDEIPAPSGLECTKFVFNTLVVFGGCLCMIDNRSNSRSDIWIMKEYGVRDSWTKITVDADCGWDILKPLCFIGDEDEILLLTEGETLVVYNLKERTLRDMLIDGVPAEYRDGGAFVETLVSPAGHV